MNCDDYRQAVSGNPADESDAMRRHAAECADCRACRVEWQSFDDTLARAMAIAVPEFRMPESWDGGYDGGHDDKVVALPRRRPSVPAWFGIAAGVALAAWLGLLAVSGSRPDLTLAEEVIAHMDHERYALVVTNVAVPERTLDSVVSGDVAELGPGIGLITYARSCVINGNLVPHLVFQGENGPVTLLLLPDEEIESAIPLHGQNINGVILPVGKGSIAIVGGRDDPIRQIGNRVVDSVKWSI
jgi:hypothetical protein